MKEKKKQGLNMLKSALKLGSAVAKASKTKSMQDIAKAASEGAKFVNKVKKTKTAEKKASKPKRKPPKNIYV